MKGSEMRAVTPDNISWKKSSYSAANGNCVEVARFDAGYIGVRDSKNSALPALGFTPASWRTFVGDVKRNRQP
ncbi:MAG TPA: DUF397 domain-containing protein [Streptosporangiaceae bacterium]|nr:DUF397 domain-containing protein [Streptosporangiaceae bacterium]